MIQIEVPDITVEMWEAGRAAYANWIFRTYRQGMPTEEDRVESARIAIAAMRAAAPAASGGEDGIDVDDDADYLDAVSDVLEGIGKVIMANVVRGIAAHLRDLAPQSPAGASQSSNPNPVTPGLSSESGASVSERARALLAEEWKRDGHPAMAHALLNADLLSDKNPAIRAITRALEQALTQQRGAEPGMANPYHREPTQERCAETLRWAASILYMWEGDPNETGYMGDFKDAEQILHLLAHHATTTPQPGAEALHSLLATMRKRADELEENSLEADSIGRETTAAVLDGKSKVLREVADELESLLARGTE